MPGTPATTPARAAFLLRLTYDPINLNGATVSPGRYIKIESIGREGVIDPIDPTTFGNNRSSDRLQAYQVAYKPLGITDYARFETNLDKRSDVANLGVVSQYSNVDPDGEIVTPGVYDFNSGSAFRLYPVATTYGASDAYLQDTTTKAISLNPKAGTGQAAPAGFNLVPGGGSVHANMTTRYYGKNIVYMYDSGAEAPSYQDTMEIAGDLLLDAYDPNISLENKTYTAPAGGPATRPDPEGQRASLVVNPPTPGPTPLSKYVSPSNDTGSNGGFDTFGGLIRDGSPQNDPQGLPRGISRLEPPVMDGTDPASTLPRYKFLAMMSPPRIDPSTLTYDTSGNPTNAGTPYP